MTALDAVKKFLVRPSTWRFVTSGSGELGVGIGKFTVGATGGVFWVQEDSSPTQYRLPFLGLGGGVGLGVSPPVVISYGDKDFPSEGIGKIYMSPCKSSLTLDDFLGGCVIYGVGGTALGGITSNGLGGVGFTLVFFGVPEILLCNPTLTSSALFLCSGAGLLWGRNIADSIGVGVSAYTGRILPPLAG
jgi:hypothetical protein